MPNQMKMMRWMRTVLHFGNLKFLHKIQTIRCQQRMEWKNKKKKKNNRNNNKEVGHFLREKPKR